MAGGPASRILVVEDDASLAESITAGLMDEGFAVGHASDGNTAWQTIQTAGWELIILDWWLPGQDGLAILRRYRDGGGVTPVLFLTAAMRSVTASGGLTAAPMITCANHLPSRSCWCAFVP